ncbi:hypothetical protein CARUB_v10018144mg [Capsella rubella]|uniref:Wbp11/ELF5/Saf1 N-terminal domain-containing protein n=1 Tax=Capsella rubella TaxID=81985 RepID=R0H6D8_9BRAS|nr:uncharacterized protein LOC17886678 isoform X3 [Capsella rubella]EOA24854.1 hypothetical protein CARUB_v10018144mg [Capsella rubella]
MKTTKEGKAMMIPTETDAFHKEQRNKELKRNKLERKVREVGILKKGPKQINLEQIRKLDKSTCLHILQENKAERGTPVAKQLTRAEKDAIFRSVVPIQKGRRFGVGSIPFDEEVGQSSYKKTSEDLSRQFSEIKEQIKELKNQLKEVAFWCNKMAQLYPNLVPPS